MRLYSKIGGLLFYRTWLDDVSGIYSIVRIKYCFYSVERLSSALSIRIKLRSLKKAFPWLVSCNHGNRKSSPNTFSYCMSGKWTASCCFHWLPLHWCELRILESCAALNHSSCCEQLFFSFLHFLMNLPSTQSHLNDVSLNFLVKIETKQEFRQWQFQDFIFISYAFNTFQVITRVNKTSEIN